MVANVFADIIVHPTNHITSKRQRSRVNHVNERITGVTSNIPTVKTPWYPYTSTLFSESTPTTSSLILSWPDKTVLITYLVTGNRSRFILYDMLSFLHPISLASWNDTLDSIYTYPHDISQTGLLLLFLYNSRSHHNPITSRYGLHPASICWSSSRRKAHYRLWVHHGIFSWSSTHQCLSIGRGEMMKHLQFSGVSFFAFIFLLLFTSHSLHLGYPQPVLFLLFLSGLDMSPVLCLSLECWDLDNPVLDGSRLGWGME